MSTPATEPSNGFLAAPIRECSTQERSSRSAASVLSTCATATYRAASISTIPVQSCARSGCCQLLHPTPSDADPMNALLREKTWSRGARMFGPEQREGTLSTKKEPYDATANHRGTRFRSARSSRLRLQVRSLDEPVGEL